MDGKLMLTEKERRLNGPWLSFPRFLVIFTIEQFLRSLGR